MICSILRRKPPEKRSACILAVTMISSSSLSKCLAELIKDSSAVASITPDLSSSLKMATLPRWPLMMRKSLTMPANTIDSRLSINSSILRRANWRTSRSTASNKWPERKKPTAVFSSNKRSLMPQGITATKSGSWVLDPCESSPNMSNKPPWLALATVAAANSKALSMLTDKAARFMCKESKAPALMSASTVRLLMRLRSTRTAKSNKLLKGPPSLRAATIASIACWPVPLMAPNP